MKISLSDQYTARTGLFLYLIILGGLGFWTKDAITMNELIRVQAEVDKSVITIGDRITYSLTIQHAPNLKIEQPGPGANLGQFEIKDYIIHEAIKEDGLISQTIDYEISVFDTGRFEIPPFPVAFAESDTSQKYQIIQSEPLEITVNSVLGAEDNEIRDIKPPLAIPLNYWRWVIFGSVALTVILAILLVIYYFHWRKKGIPLFRKEPVRPAHEIALEDIEAFSQQWSELFQEGEYKQIFTRVSEILRRYLENRYFVKALEETTTEIRQSLEEIDLENDSRFQAIGVLEFSDLVKFAKFIPSEDNILSNIESLENFIHATKLVFENLESSNGSKLIEVNTTPEPEAEYHNQQDNIEK
jgi:hypothetical protein